MIKAFRDWLRGYKVKAIINYKSGIQMVLYCDEMEVVRSSDKLTKISWKHVRSVSKPLLIANDLDNIESVWIES